MHLHQDCSLYKCCPKKRQDNSVICYAFYYFKSCYRFHKMNLNLLIPVNGGEEKKKETSLLIATQQVHEDGLNPWVLKVTLLKTDHNDLTRWGDRTSHWTLLGT